MKPMTFLLGSALGFVGALLQLALNQDAMLALNTFAFFALGLPLVTSAAQRDNKHH